MTVQMAHGSSTTNVAVYRRSKWPALDKPFPCVFGPSMVLSMPYGYMRMSRSGIPKQGQGGQTAVDRTFAFEEVIYYEPGTKENNMTFKEFYDLHRHAVHKQMFGDRVSSGMCESLWLGAEVKQKVKQMFEHHTKENAE